MVTKGEGRTMEENVKKEHICLYICVTESFCCIPEANTTLEIKYTPIQNKN